MTALTWIAATSGTIALAVVAYRIAAMLRAAWDFVSAYPNAWEA